MSLKLLDRESDSEEDELGVVHDNGRRRRTGLKELVMGAPRDLWVVVAGVLLESLAYFSMSFVFILMLEGEYMYDDVKSTSTYAAFGIAISMHGVLFGWLVDWLRVRRSLLLYAGLGLISKALLGLLPSEATLWVVMLGPMAFSLSIGGTATLAGIRRYTTDDTRNVAFSFRYVMMNLGALISEPVTDAVRLRFVPAMRELGMPGYSLFIAITAVIHLVHLALVFFLVRDLHVAEEPWRHVPGADVATTEHSSAHSGDYVTVRSRKWALRHITVPPLACCNRNMARTCAPRAWMREKWAELRAHMTRRLAGFILLSFGVMGAQSVFRYLDSLYPLWMTRAPYPVSNPAEVPFTSFLIINPAMVLLFTTMFANLAERRLWHPYWIILLGTAISATSPFWMMIVQYWAVFIFIIQLSLGEIIWSPMLSTYSCWFAPEGREGIFFALATIPVFGAKAAAGVMSGQVLKNYCPPHIHNATQVINGTLATVIPPDCSPVIWTIVAAVACSSPLVILVFYKCIKIPRPQPEDMKVEMDTTSTDYKFSIDDTSDEAADFN